jgi:hypothetical protein
LSVRIHNTTLDVILDILCWRWVGWWVQEDGAGCDPALFTELAAKVEARVSTCPALATAKVPLFTLY